MGSFMIYYVTATADLFHNSSARFQNLKPTYITVETEHRDDWNIKQILKEFCCLAYRLRLIFAFRL